MSENFDRIEAYVLGKLSEAEAKQFERDLASQPELQEELQVYRLSQFAIEENIESSLRTEMEGWGDNSKSIPPKSKIPSYRLWWIAAALIGLAIVFWFLNQSTAHLTAKELANNYFPDQIKIETLRGVESDSIFRLANQSIDQGVTFEASQSESEATQSFENAIDILSTISQNSPYYPASLFQNGILHYHLNQFDEAARIFNILKSIPNNKYQEEAKWYELLAKLAAGASKESLNAQLENLINDANFSLNNQAKELKKQIQSLDE